MKKADAAWDAARGFNEAGAIEPRKPVLALSKTGSTDSRFNEAGAIEPRKHRVRERSTATPSSLQ